ncbi:Sua5/YciO/YrdC/YwlC family protein, partial [Acidithiobacillus ferriphilus]
MLPRHPRRQDIRRGIAHLRRGGVIAYPTEGVWGLGCDPRQRRALRRVLVLKRRPQHKGVLL